MPSVPVPQSTAAPAAPLALPKGSASEVYAAVRAQRDLLGGQLGSMEGQRRELVSEIGTAPSAAGRKGHEAELAQLDARMAATRAQIANADQLLVQAAAVPGAIPVSPRRPPAMPDPDMLAGLSFLLAFAVLVPFAIAAARRWARKPSALPHASPDLVERMAAMERGIDAIALEVERIGESQRFLTQAIASRVELPAAHDAGRERVPASLPRTGD
jgi:hypothetical protein